MMRTTVRRSQAMVLVACACFSTVAAAQTTPAVERTTVRARAMLDAGDGSSARALLDSLVGAVPAGSADLAEALYWRAVFAERVNDAEKDWKKLVVEVPLSSRAPDALVRLGELDMLRGHPADARVYFTRLLRDFPAGEYRTKGLIWLARSYFDERNAGSGCSALDSLRGMDLPDGELRLQSSELLRRCATPSANNVVPQSASPGSSSSTAPSTSPNTSPNTSPSAPPRAPSAPGAGRYSVQLAAYDTRAEADAAVARFAKRAIDARVDGERKPFRVRVGYHTTRAAAAAALATLKKQGFDGFIAERTP